jgi:hypothetical protein
VHAPYVEHVPPDTTAGIFWMKNRDPAHWRDAWQLEHVGILAAVPRRNSTDLLFPSRVSDERPLSGWSKYKKQLDELAGVRGYTLHDLRRTYRTIYCAIGTAANIGERLVNHVAAVTTEAARIYMGGRPRLARAGARHGLEVCLRHVGRRPPRRSNRRPTRAQRALCSCTCGSTTKPKAHWRRASKLRHATERRCLRDQSRDMLART